METLNTALLKTYRNLALSLVFAGVVLGALAPFVLKSRFKSTAVVSISPQYFQLPLVRDFMSELYDPTELRSQRESLIRQAFNDQFLDALRPAKEGETKIQRAQARQELARAIEIIPLQATDYQIGVISNDREKAQTILQSGLDNLVAVMKSERGKMLSGLREAVAEQVADVDHGPSDSSVSRETEESRLRGQLSALKKIYSTTHPQVRAVEARLKFLHTGSAVAAAATTSTSTASESITGEARKQTYADLVRKLTYLDIALKVEATRDTGYLAIVKSPDLPLAGIGPSRVTFILWGALAGFFIAVLLAFFREAQQGNLVILTGDLRTPSVKAPIFGGPRPEGFLESETPTSPERSPTDELAGH